MPIPIVSQESVHAKPQQLPPDLALVIETWPQLPDAIRLAIVAIAKASNGTIFPDFITAYKWRSVSQTHILSYLVLF